MNNRPPSAPEEPLTEALISLGNLSGNVRYARKRAGETCRIMGVVKADAYGHGAQAVARHLETCGIHDFGVANVQEAMELRRSQAVSDRSGILAFCTPPPSHLVHYMQYDTELTVADTGQLHAASARASAYQKPLTVHVKVDTGMGRLGLSCREAMDVLLAAEQDPWIHLKGVYTHFAQSTVDDGFTRRQLQEFLQLCSEFEHRTGRKIIRHAANSGALLCMPESRLDMVRPGIMLYGYAPERRIGPLPELRPVMQLQSRVIFIKNVRSGTPISYNRSWVAPADCRIATVAAGYADGYHRLLSNRAMVTISGRRYPQAGNVTMDQLMVNLGTETGIREGERVTLFGWDGPTAADLADLCGTISYELLCSVSGRVKRTIVE
ncbi:alanine racemase [Prosthecochloris sp. ZM_2]|uniref:alanine racemase n=1 Tax=Prosthecochloris sp. ZM_2 TaxID=2045206 RepID=UPI000DF7B275|nr:alanine racemase [Prosthecochloris sp. ZM_2]RNA65462.1 alanine racemase [Prosthecochloris sp. ZM_2]